MKKRKKMSPNMSKLTTSAIFSSSRRNYPAVSGAKKAMSTLLTTNYYAACVT